MARVSNEKTSGVNFLKLFFATVVAKMMAGPKNLVGTNALAYFFHESEMMREVL
jgi:hypothetical protein